MQINVRTVVPDADQAEVRSLEESEAVRLVLTGAVALDADQPVPPFALLEALEARNPDPSVFGPAISNPKVLKRFADLAFAHGQRQTVVEGQPFVWFGPGNSFLTEARTRLSMCTEHPADLFLQLQRALDRYGKTRAIPLTLCGPVSESEMRAQRFVRGRTANFLKGTVDCIQYSAPWFEFRDKLRALKQGWQSLISSALYDGRILVSEERDAGSCFCHPTQTSEIRFSFSNAPYRFCFGSSLPMDWFADETPLHKRRSEARKWMVRAFLHFNEDDRRAGVDALKTVAMERFQLSPNAATQAWSEARRELPTELGRPADSRRVSIHEIREIE